MTEWKSYPLGELCSLRAGVAFKTADQGSPSGEFPFIKVSDMNLSQNSIAIRDANNWVDTDYIKRTKAKIFPVGTVVFAKIGEALKHNRVRQIVRPTLIDNNMMGAIPNPEVVQRKFLYYMLSSFDIASTATGTALPYLTVSVLERQRFLVPPLGVQRRIASILSAYDDLIENNTRRIAILEEMARRIYEEWFVRFRFPGHEQVKMVDSELGLIPEGWKVGSLSDVFDNVRESTKPGEHLRQRRYVPIDCIGRRTLVLPETRPYEEAQSSLILFETDDILFGAMRPYFHKVAIAPCAGVTRTTCFVLRAKSAVLGAYGTVLAFSDPVVAYASAHTQGATIPYAVWDGSLANYAIPVPPESLLRQFDELVRPMLIWLRRAMFRQENLRATRDLLLPKLISGELDVSTLPEPEEAIAA